MAPIPKGLLEVWDDCVPMRPGRNAPAVASAGILAGGPSEGPEGVDVAVPMPPPKMLIIFFCNSAAFDSLDSGLITGGAEAEIQKMYKQLKAGTTQRL